MKRRTSHMHATEESDEDVVPEKPVNNDWQQSAESVEERSSTKRNAQQEPVVRSQTRTATLKRLERIRQRASGDPDCTFNNLYSLLSVELLGDSFYALKRNAAPGLDKSSTHRLYECGLRRPVDAARRAGANGHGNGSRNIEHGCFPDSRSSIRFLIYASTSNTRGRSRMH